MAVALLTLFAAGCGGFGPLGGSATPTITPRPDQPCGGLDVQQAPGFYPDLEALLPRSLDGQSPQVRDSGRYCSPAKLGTLFTRDDYREVRFAGAVWSDKAQTAGVSTVVYRAAGLTADQVADSFAVAAGGAQNITRVVSTPQTIDGRAGIRIEVINQDTTQVVVVWPAAAAGTIDIVLGSGAQEPQIDGAVAALGRG